MKDRNVIIIPARYGSSRFPGKPLKVLEGVSIIERTYRQAKKALDDVYVATDDERIAKHVSTFGEVLMTSTEHQSGTDRIAEAVAQLSFDVDYVINVQGDEPLIDPQQIIDLNKALDGQVEIATQAVSITSEEEFISPDNVKVVFSKLGRALYFSRSGIPFERNKENVNRYKHIGIYAYRTDILQAISKLEMTDLERTESLEQLRWLENDMKIFVQVTKHNSPGIDTPEDMAMAANYLRKINKNAYS